MARHAQSAGIVVTGTAGLTGYHVLRRLNGIASVIALYHVRRPPPVGDALACDLRQRQAVNDLMDRLRPEAVVHCAAHSDTSYCEEHPQEAYDMNAGAAENLASWACRHDVFLTHVSTDLVFDGQKGNYSEEDATHPLGVYAHTKLEAERLVQRSGAPSCIARTSLIYGRSPAGNHSVNEKLVMEWRQGRPTVLFTDEFRCPTPVGDLAEALIEITLKKVTGLLHIAGVQPISRYDLGKKIAGILGSPPELLVARSLDEVSLPRPRARDATLNISRAQSLLSCRFTPLDEALRRECGDYSAPSAPQG